LIRFLYRCVGGGIIEEGLTKVLIKGFTLIVPLVHGTWIGLIGVGGGASGVTVRAKGHISNYRGRQS